MGSHTAAGLFGGFMEALTKPTKNSGDLEILLIEKEVCQKTAIFLADGASVMGVRKKGTSADKAQEGKNVFALLQTKCDDLLADVPHALVLGYWCGNHRYDKIASDAEQQISHIKDLLSFLKSIVGHVSS